MDVRSVGVRGEDVKAAAGRNWMATAQIVAANAAPSSACGFSDGTPVRSSSTGLTACLPSGAWGGVGGGRLPRGPEELRRLWSEGLA